MSSALRAERRVGLHDHLVGAAEAVEVVDVERAEVDLHGLEDVGQRARPAASPCRGRRRRTSCGTLIWKLLKNAGAAPASAYALRHAAACIAPVERLVAEAGAVLDLQLEAADGAEAVAPAAAGTRATKASWMRAELRVERAGDRVGRELAASCAPRTASRPKNTMPAFGALVKPLIDRPGKATASFDARHASSAISDMRRDHLLGAVERRARRAAARSRPGTACPASARSPRGTRWKHAAR